MLICSLWFKSYHIKFTSYSQEEIDPVNTNAIFLRLIISQKDIIFLSFCRMSLYNVSTYGFHFERFISQRKILCRLIDFSFWSLIFSQKKIIVLSICRRNFSNVRKCGFHFEKYISQKKFLMIGTSTEEFHPVHENVTYNSLFMYLSAERIFPINFKMVFR